MQPGQPNISLAHAARAREQRILGTCKSLPPSIIQSYDTEREARIQARIAPMVAKLTEDLSAEHRALRLDEARGIVVDAKAMAPEIRYRILESLFVEISKAISSIDPRQACATVLYEMIEGFSGLADESAEYRASGMSHGVDISKSALESPTMLAVVWFHKRMVGVSRNTGHLVNADRVLGLMAFEEGPDLDELSAALRDLNKSYPDAGLESILGNPRLEPALLLVKNEFLEKVQKLGGISYLVGKGYDLSVVFGTILTGPGKMTMPSSLKKLKFLLALVDHQYSVGDLSDEWRSLTLGRIMQSALITLNNKDAGKQKGWKEFIANLAPHTPSYLTAGQYVALGRVAPFDPIPHWGRPLSSFVERGKFRKAVKKTVNPECQIKVIKNLNLESFYSKNELFRIAGLKGILMDTVACLDRPPANEDAGLQCAVIEAKILIDSHKKHSPESYDRAFARFLPYMTSDLGNLPWIILAKVASTNEQGSSMNWPDNLEKTVNKDDFNRSLNALTEPEQRYQIVKRLGLESFYSRSDILGMKGSRLSVDLGL